MLDDERLRAKLAKVEALFRRTGSAGERAAAEAALERLKGRLGASHEESKPEIELQFSLPDMWSVRLFLAVCRRHGVRTYRYARQRRTTVMVRTRREFFDQVVLPEFDLLHDELESYFEDVTDQLIERALGSDGDDGFPDPR